MIFYEGGEMKGWGLKYISLYFFRSIELAALNRCATQYLLLDPILDLGCGDGTFTAEFLGNYRNIVGIDNSQKELDKNKCVHTYKEVVNADACKTPFPDNTFSTVFSNCVLEHIPNLDAVLEEVSRVLKPGGYFIFTVPTNKFEHFLLFSSVSKWYGEVRNKRLNHYHCYNLSKWRHTLYSKKLVVKWYEYYLPKNALRMWDFLALCTYHLWGVSFIFSKLLHVLTEKGIEKYSQELIPNTGGAAIVIVAKKG